MKAFRRRAVVYVLSIVTLLSTAAPAAFAGRGEGCHRAPGHNQPGNCHIGSDFQHYNPGNCPITADCPNTQFCPHHYGNTVSADIGGDSNFSGGFCVIASLTQGNETLVIDCQDIAHDKVWLRDTVSGNYYPIENQADDSIEIADNGWADSNAAIGEVEAEVLFSTTASGGGENNTDSESSGGGCNAAGQSFGIAGIFVMLGIWGRLVLKKR